MLEQRGQIDRALTIYQHILKHLEGTPAITKVLPLYVKAGDLLHKLNRPEEAVASYQTAAEHYASTGAAPRVTALCGKILRLVPQRTDVYTDFVRQLISHGHVGSARDVLADYARFAGMDRAIETLDDLAGRPNAEVQPMLERLLDSFEQDEQSEQTAARVSSHLERATDDLAGELATVPDTAPSTKEVAEEEAATYEDEEQAEPVATEGPVAGETADAPEPLTPPMFDLDHLPRQSSLHVAIEDFVDHEPPDERVEGEEKKEDDTAADSRTVDLESSIAITRDVTPTMDGMPLPAEAMDGDTEEDTASGEDELHSLLAAAMAAEDAGEAADATVTPDALEEEGSQTTPYYREPAAEDKVAAEWAPEEELRPAARYPSDEYDTPAFEDKYSEAEEEEEEEEEGKKEPEEEPTEVGDEEREAPIEAAEPLETFVTASPVRFEAKDSTTPPEADTEFVRRPTRPPRVTIPRDAEAKSKSPILFGVGGFIVGLLSGAGLMFVLLGGGSGNPPTTVPVQQPAAVADTPTVQVRTTPTSEPEPTASAPVAAAPAAVRTPETLAPVEGPAVTTEAAPAVEPAAETPGEIGQDSTVTDVAGEQPASSSAPAGNPIVVEGLPIAEISEIEFRGLAGYRVVHLLEWGNPIFIEAYRDTTVRLSTYIQVDVTPPDTVVGIRRLDGYMVYASGVMPEDSLRSLMSRLVEGERRD